jgi:8-oxo-dGTP diphosphatase
MAERYQVIPRTLCLIFHENEILLIKASSKKEWEGTYNALGGHIEKGESVIESANREIKEESGLDVTDTKLRGIVHAVNFFEKNVMMFVTSSTAKSTEVVNNDEGELTWIKVEEIDNIRIFEDMKPIIQHALNMKPEEIFVGTSEFDGKDKLLSFDIKIS